MGIFKAYDVRGRIPDELNEDIAYRIGRAYASFLSPSKVVVGHDIRLTSESISDALIVSKIVRFLFRLLKSYF